MKYVIIGVARCGTCSLEKYLAEQGHDVIRVETQYQITPYRVSSLYPDHKPILISCHKTSKLQLQGIKERWSEADVEYVTLDEMKKRKDFPWENRDNCLSKKGIRPVYAKKTKEQKPKLTKYAVLGFSHCGTHSMAKHLQNQGHEVWRNDGYYKRDKVTWKQLMALGYKPVFITRDEELGRRLRFKDFKQYIDKFAEFEPEVYRLEDMRKLPDFPFLNSRNETRERYKEDWERLQKSASKNT